MPVTAVGGGQPARRDCSRQAEPGDRPPDPEGADEHAGDAQAKELAAAGDDVIGCHHAAVGALRARTLEQRARWARDDRGGDAPQRHPGEGDGDPRGAQVDDGGDAGDAGPERDPAEGRHPFADASGEEPPGHQADAEDGLQGGEHLLGTPEHVAHVQRLGQQGHAVEQMDRERAGDGAPQHP